MKRDFENVIDFAMIIFCIIALVIGIVVAIKYSIKIAVFVVILESVSLSALDAIISYGNKYN